MHMHAHMYMCVSKCMHRLKRVESILGCYDRSGVSIYPVMCDYIHEIDQLTCVLVTGMLGICYELLSLFVFILLKGVVHDNCFK